jgi:hypothetical protein
VWAFGPNDVWTTGTSTRHWDGAQWTVSSNVVCSKFWGNAADSLFCIQDKGLHRFDGRNWSRVYYATSPFGALWGTSATNVVAVADGKTVFSEGSTFRLHTSFDGLQPVGVRALWAADANTFFAAGTRLFFPPPPATFGSSAPATPSIVSSPSS